MKRTIQRYMRVHKISYGIIGIVGVFFMLRFINSASEQFNMEIFSNVETNTVIVDIRIQECIKLSKCNSPAGWNKVGKRLNLHSRSFTLYDYHLLVKREPLSQATRVMSDFQITTSKSSPEDSDWVLQPFRNLMLWKQYANTNEAGFQDVDLIRDVNVLFGEKDLRDSREKWEFQFQELPLMFDTSLPVHLSLFKLSEKEQSQYLQELADFESLKREGKIISEKSRFRVMQLSDLHFSSDYHNCNEQGCRLDTRTLKFIEDTIEAEDIDFVVITGDLIDNFKINDFRSVIIKGLSPLFKKNIPFVFTFGELDFNEFNDRKAAFIKFQVLQFLSTLPNCYNYVPNQENNVHGLTNYNLQVFRKQESEPSAVLTILDSENHRIDSTQIANLYRLNQDVPQNIFKLLFFHYPLPNFRPSGKFKLIGSYNEKHALNTKTSHSYRDDIVNCGYNVISVGHEHENDACILSDKSQPEKKIQNEIWLCYNGITGDSGITQIDTKYDRRLRIFEMAYDKRRLISWKRSEAKGIGFDYQIIRQFS